MPVADGRIYVETGTPPTGVSFADVQKVLGTGKYYENELCTHPNINMWSKFKPVRKNIIDTTGQLTTSGNRIIWNTAVSNPWWKGTDDNYGLNYNNAKVQVPNRQTGMESALSDLAALIDGDMNGWSYDRPTGGESAPYRIWDFNQYWHNAPNPVNQLDMDDVMASEGSEYFVAVVPQDPDSTSPIASRVYITPLDLASFHLGFAIFKGSAPIAWVTDTATWYGVGINNSDASDGIQSRGDTEVYTKLKDNGEYMVLPFYSNVSIPQPTSSGSPRGNYSSLPSGPSVFLYTVPNTHMVSFTARQAKTRQRIAWGYPTSHMTDRLLRYSTEIFLDSRGTYYQGSQTAFPVEVIITRLSWEQYDATKPSPTPSGDVRYYKLYNVSSFGSEVNSQISTSGHCSNISLDFGETWHCFIVIDGEPIKSHDIRTLSGNNT